MMVKSKRKFAIAIIGAVLLVVPLFFIKTSFDNDIWFLLNSGRYLVNNGFPTVEPFTMHSGLSFVMQQWLTDIIFWEIYSKIGSTALLAFVYLCYLVSAALMFKLCMVISKNNAIVSILVTFFASSILASMYFVTRPISISTILLLIELLCLELYIKNKNWKYLIALPFLSLVQINIHAAYWPMLFITLLPYLVDSFNIKIKGIGGEGYKKAPLFITTLIMIPVGLINPYGIDGATYFLKSFSNSTIGKLVTEMNPINIKDDYWIVAIMAAVLVLFLFMVLRKKENFKLRYLLLILGYGLATWRSVKSFSLFSTCAIFSLAFSLRNVRPKIKKSKDFTLKRKMIISVLALAIIFTGVGGVYIYNHANIENEEEPPIMQSGHCYEAVEYIVDNYDVQKVRLYCGYNDGGYAEYMGIKPYMDPRAEVFIKSVNKQKDILDEYYKMRTGKLACGEFVSNYNFTHFLVTTKDKMYYFLSAHPESYQLIYQDAGHFVYKTK